MAATDIEWTESTWNPVAGCTILSPGCKNCYAMRMAARLEAMGVEKYAGTTRKSGGRYVWTGKIIAHEDSLNAPLKWKKPQRIFVNSMSDLFHEDVSLDFIEQVFDVMSQSSWHTFQLLTKRPERMAKIVSQVAPNPLPNVWLGTSVEDAEHLFCLDWLRITPAAVRFVSFEPLLGLINDPDLSSIHWAIVGGESGPKARILEGRWVNALHQACQEQDVAFFFKQWGGKNKKATGRTLHGRTWEEYPFLGQSATI